MASTLKHVEQLMGSLAAQASTFQENNRYVTTLLENTARLSQELPALIQRVTQSVGAMDQTVKTINHAVYNFNRLITDTRQDLSQFSRDGLTCYPPRSLVRNAGMDGSGTHGRGTLRNFGGVSNFVSEVVPRLPANASRCTDEEFSAVKRAVWRQNGGWRGRLVDSVRSLSRYLPRVPVARPRSS